MAELAATRLCMEIPGAGRRIFETGDEYLVRLAHETRSAFLATTRQRAQRWTPIPHPTNVLNAIPIVSQGMHVSWQPAWPKGSPT